MRKAVLATLALAMTATAEPPRFAGDELLRPTGYHEWPLVGSSLAMSYQEAEARPAAENFHLVYLEPASFRAFRDTGEFPEGATLVMEVFSAGSRASINRQGRFADQFLRMETAVKDSGRFPEGWAYFDFGESAARAKPFDKERCWSCHNEHGAADNVFTQFYPILRIERERTVNRSANR